MSKINWEEIKEDYLSYKDNMTLKEFAEKHKVKYSTLRSRKNREKWDNVATCDATEIKSVATKDMQQAECNKIEYKKEIEKLEDADLTDKQRLFCCYYIESFNATKAYQKAYRCDYSTANANGSRLLVNASIKIEIDRLTQECLKEQEIDSKLISKRVFQKYLDIAFADITDYVEFGSIEVPFKDENTNAPKLDENGKPITYNISYVDLQDSKELDGTIVSEVSKGKDGAKIKLYDKMKALQWLSDRMDLLPIETQVKIEKTKADINKLTGANTDIEDLSEVIGDIYGDN